MADQNALAGFASVTIDGAAYSIVGEGTYRTASPDRETLKGQDGIHGFSEMPNAGKISWKGRDSGAVSIEALNKASNVTVVLVLINGKTIIGRNMWRVGPAVEVNTEDASFAIEFESADVTEA
ncbi:MAG: phage tail tube protein [Pseudomonadota bacterium]|jgi:hypothetical protein|nr:phage tail tube protein [Pseudomonadota bacterium]